MSQKLFVFGCSYSDYTGVDKTYGEYAAELAGLEYRHCARGCTSNYRSWRMITRMVLDGEITANDIVVYQPTDRHRREFASYGIGYEENVLRVKNTPSTHPGKTFPAQEKFVTGCGEFYTSHYKSNSYTWQISDPDRQLHQAYQQSCAVEAFDDETFIVGFKQFEAFCQLNDIKLIVLWCRLSDNFYEYDILSDWSKRLMLLEENVITYCEPRNYKYELGAIDPENIVNETNWDSSHLSVLGHQTLGKALADHLHRYSLIQ